MGGGDRCCASCDAAPEGGGANGAAGLSRRRGASSSSAAYRPSAAAQQKTQVHAVAATPQRRPADDDDGRKNLRGNCSSASLRSGWIALVVALSTTAALTCVVVGYGGPSTATATTAAAAAAAATGALLRRGGCRDDGGRRPRLNVILTASHLRGGTADGELRLRIVEHNLRLLLRSGSDGGGGAARDDSGESTTATPFKSIVVFSTDDASRSGSSSRDAVDEWRGRPSVRDVVDDVLFVPNDAVLVDASKWIAALYDGDLLPEVRRTDARVVLMNDSFVLTRAVPELWDDGASSGSGEGESEWCGRSGVCGLAWTAPPSDPARHVQSYLRSLSSCQVENYVRFYEENKDGVRNVNELIRLFEINLGWARRGEGGAGGGDNSADVVSAIYEYAGEHPDSDAAQRVLVPRGYPAIKLKKFFVTDDPWLSSKDQSRRTRLPPDFSPEIYKRMNHDLNHLSDEDLGNHFATSGKDEDRIYSSRPLVVKDWIRAELTKLDGGAEGGEGDGTKTMRILEDYLSILNAAVSSS